jgi:hypothetical protein
MHPWVILIEQLEGNGQNARWRPSLADLSYATRGEAQQAAWALTKHFTPQHPFSQGHRTVLRHNDDAFTVIVEGVTMNSHFTLTVCENVT